MDRLAFPAVVTFLAIVRVLAAEDGSILVHADRVTNTVTPYMTGACIEDVNHEIYGGLYSQMIFGESFQEPPAPAAPAGFTAFGGNWRAAGGELEAAAGDGPKLVPENIAFGNGEVSVDIFLADKHPGNAGVLVRLKQPGVGADKFIGYEIALSEGSLLLGRHRNNWEPIQTIPCQAAANQWVTLVVRTLGNTIEALVDGKPVLKYEDREHPLEAGTIALRTWQRPARFRNLSITSGGQARRLSFEPGTPEWAAGVSGMWRAFRTASAAGSFAIDTRRPFIGAQSQRLDFTSGEGKIGLENRGLNRWGMSFVAGKPFEGLLWVRSEKRVRLNVELQSGDGSKSYATAPLDTQPGDWQRITFTLTPSATDPSGRFAVSLEQPGSVTIGYAFLQPGEWGRFKGLPVRKDVADGLVAQRLTVLRYGGSMVNDPEYRWKKMIGPRDRRPPYKGTWYPYSSNGFGILDFLDFCEAAGFLGIPDLDVNESPADIRDFIEYVNGPADSEWGRRRAADGHPAPYALKYIELGNEEAVNESYWKKFKPLAEAIWEKDPSVTPVVGDFAYGEHIADPFHFTGAPNISSLVAHKSILDFASAKHKAVWFDVHVWNDKPRDPVKQIDVLGELISWLGKISPGADFKVCVFEENSGNHAVRRAIAHARAINGLQRLGNHVPIVCCANCLQCDGQNDNGWDQGLLFLNPSRVWAQPPYYVTQMIATETLPKCVQAEVKSPGDALDVTARTSEDGKVLVLQVVNMEDQPVTSSIVLDGFARKQWTVTGTQLSGQWLDVNTAENAAKIVPTPIERAAADHDRYTFAARSFTVLRFQ